MNESNQSYLKRFLRIGTCGLGWLCTILGFLLAMHALSLIPAGVSRFLPFVFMSASTLTAGIYLLSIWWQKPLAEWRKLSEEERAIRDFRQYIMQCNHRIVSSSFLLIFMVSGSVFLFWQEWRIDQVADMENLSHFYYMAAAKAKVMYYGLFFGVLTGCSICTLLNDIFGFTRNKLKLTLTMWERIKQLEDEVKTLKAHAQADDRHGIDHTTN